MVHFVEIRSNRILACECTKNEYEKNPYKGLVINYGEGAGGLQNGKIAGPKLFAPPPLKPGYNFSCPPFKEWKLFVPPPIIWLKLQATA